MRTPEFTPTTLRAATATQPLPGYGGQQGASFAQAMRSAHAEIHDLVQNGWAASELPALGAQGLMHRAAALQAMLQPAPSEPAAAAAAGTRLAPAPATGPAVPVAAQQDFLQSIGPWAREAGAALGVAPELVAAHAALDSGWGRRPLRGADGGDSHNLFGIKASGGWRGASVQALTTEYLHGDAQKSAESFRAYPDPASAFRDYAQLLQANPRYQNALNVGSDADAFAQALARGGYATDPDYASKLSRVVRQVQARGVRE